MSDASADTVVDQWLRWAEKEFGGPPSRVLAATAAIMRTLEQRQGQARAIEAGRATAEGWKPKEPWTPNDKMKAVQEQWRKWAEKEFVAPPSKVFAATAGAMRAIEYRQDAAHAVSAARAAAERFSPGPDPVKPAAAAKPAPASPDIGEAPAGMIRGQVYGFVRHPARDRADRYYETWSLSVRRTGVGPNGRPLSPVPVSLMGRRFDGELEDGDIVEFAGEAEPAMTMYPRKLRNVSKNVDIVPHGIRGQGKVMFYTALGITRIFQYVFTGVILVGVGILLLYLVERLSKGH
jgi:hypothetical protein